MRHHGGGCDTCNIWNCSKIAQKKTWSRTAKAWSVPVYMQCFVHLHDTFKLRVIVLSQLGQTASCSYACDTLLTTAESCTPSESNERESWRRPVPMRKVERHRNTRHYLSLFFELTDGLCLNLLLDHS